MMAIQAGVRWYICISVIISNIEHLFIFSLAHLYVFFGKMSIWIIFPFFDWIICFYGIEGHVVVQSLSCVWPFATPSAVPRQASLSITISLRLFKLMSTESAMWSNYLILSPPSPLALNVSEHQGLFQWSIFSQQVAKILELQFQYQSFQWIFRFDFF